MESFYLALKLSSLILICKSIVPHLDQKCNTNVMASVQQQIPFNFFSFIIILLDIYIYIQISFPTNASLWKHLQSQGQNHSISTLQKQPYIVYSCTPSQHFHHLENFMQVNCTIFNICRQGCTLISLGKCKLEHLSIVYCFYF